MFVSSPHLPRVLILLDSLTPGYTIVVVPVILATNTVRLRGAGCYHISADAHVTASQCPLAMQDEEGQKEEGSLEENITVTKCLESGHKWDAGIEIFNT